MKRNCKIALFTAALAASAVLGGFVALNLKTAAPLPRGGGILPPPVLPGAGEGIVTSLTGECFVLRAGTWKVLEIGDLLSEADTVRVLTASYCEIQFDGLATMRMKENTQAELASVKPGAASPDLRLKLLGGTVLYKVKKAVGIVKIETSTGVLGVRGTEFMVRQTKFGVFVAVKEGFVAFEGGEEVGAGSELLKAAGEAAAKPAPLSSEAKESLGELDRVRFLDLPETGIPRMARVVVMTEPRDALILAAGVAVAKGSYSLIVPFGETVKLTAAKPGYKERIVEIPVVSGDAGKVYVVRLEIDPAAVPVDDVSGAALKNRLETAEKELRASDDRLRALSKQRDALGSEKEALAKKSAALEAEIRSLNARLADQETKVKNALELLQGKK